ncbi:undecaprenyl-diphosphate phosphatase, partial [Salmonella enterica]|uniref:undecaprenyl-diphosphate phosphatase n=1 Tax=Salmonella enterica TaxID=28901 RepID=UPI003FA6EFF5
MFAVVWEYRQRLMGTVRGLGSGDPVARRFALNVLVAFIPAVVLGLALGKTIKAHLFKPVPVAMAFIVGALLILWIERIHRARYGQSDTEGQR